MEKNVLFKNKSLEKIFTAATFLWKEPLVISQVSFADKELFNGSLLFCGDAAGLITPLCGNGMSIALRSAHLLAPLVDMFLRRDISAAEMCRQYSHQWQQHFSKRLQTGRRIQIMFGNNAVTSAFLQSCRIFPGITRKLIRSTHGDTF
jgi:flavin-dependent dehydrogenase